MGHEKSASEFQGQEEFDFDEGGHPGVEGYPPQPEVRKQAEPPVRQDGVTQVARVRASGSFRPVSAAWCEVALRIRLNPDGPWLRITPKDHPLLVARRYSGDREAPELYVISALKQALQSHGAEVLNLTGSESRQGDGHTEWRYWAQLGSRLTVALQTLPDGTVALLGLQ